MKDRNNKVLELSEAFNTIRLANEICNDKAFRENYVLHDRILNLDSISFKKVCSDIGENIDFLFDGYEKAILRKYGEFIRLGYPEKENYKFKTIIYEANEDELINNKNYYHLIQDNNIIIGVNSKRPNRGLIYTRALLEGYCNRMVRNEKGFVFYFKGFGLTIADRMGKAVFQENEPLSEGLMWALAVDINKEIQQRENIVSGKLFDDSPYLKELIMIVNKFRNLVNLNLEGREYDPSKDVLIYDYFVKKNIHNTRNAFDNKFGKGTFDYINQKIDSLGKVETKDIAGVCRDILKDIENIEKNIK